MRELSGVKLKFCVFIGIWAAQYIRNLSYVNISVFFCM